MTNRHILKFMVKTYSIYEARAKFSELVRNVLKSGSVLITQRGVPVIRLVPYSPDQESIEERVRELERIGKARIAKNKWPKRYSANVLAKSAEGAIKRFFDDRE